MTACDILKPKSRDDIINEIKSSLSFQWSFRTFLCEASLSRFELKGYAYIANLIGKNINNLYIVNNNFTGYNMISRYVGSYTIINLPRTLVSLNSNEFFYNAVVFRDKFAILKSIYGSTAYLMDMDDIIKNITI